MKRPVFLQKIYSQKDLINPWDGMPVGSGCVAILSVIEGIKSSLRPNSNPLQMNWGLSTIACPKFDSVAPEMPSGQSSGLTLRKKTLFLPLQPPNPDFSREPYLKVTFCGINIVVRATYTEPQKVTL